MNDDNEKYWGDLVSRLKTQLQKLDPNEDKTAFHNRIWEAISEAFRRGQTVKK